MDWIPCGNDGSERGRDEARGTRGEAHTREAHEVGDHKHEAAEGRGQTARIDDDRVVIIEEGGADGNLLR